MPSAEQRAEQTELASSDATSCGVCGAQLTEARCTACGAAARPGGYGVQRLIAQTPHSRVYLAQAPGGQQVALKELLFAQVPGTHELEAFEREARLLETLSHPRIPRLMGHFQEGQGTGLRLYLAAEHISGETLLERLANHSVSEEEARDIGLQVLEILEYLHGRSPRVIHRDIKPANLIRQPEGKIFLVDFGSARESVRGATVGSTLVGTFGYMPLEQLGGTVDVTSDLYALGATLVHLLGRTPPAELFRPERGLELAHLNAPRLLPWLQKLTAVRPQDRYSSATLARQALQALRPGGMTVVPDLLPVVSLPADAPAVLARFAHEAQKSQEVHSQAQRREEQKALDEAQKAAQLEARKREELKAHEEDDTLAFRDYFLMASFRIVLPAVMHVVALCLAVSIYFTLPAIEIIHLPDLDTLAGIGLPLGLVAGAYAVVVGPVLLRALWRRRAVRRLSFALEGFGKLVHRGDKVGLKCIRCELRVVMKEAGVPPDTVSAARDTILGLVVSCANETLSRLAGHGEEFQKLHWSLKGDRAHGYANWRMAGQFLKLCTGKLTALQRELGLIEAVVIEPSKEFSYLPDNSD